MSELDGGKAGADPEKPTDSSLSHDYDETLPNMIDYGQMDLGRLDRDRGIDKFEGTQAKNGVAWREISAKFGSNVKLPELVSIATVLANAAKIKLDRVAKRRKNSLIQWFHEKWDVVSPFFKYVVLEEQNRV